MKRRRYFVVEKRRNPFACDGLGKNLKGEVVGRKCVLPDGGCSLLVDHLQRPLALVLKPKNVYLDGDIVLLDRS